jgi:hypothetical protein
MGHNVKCTLGHNSFYGMKNIMNPKKLLENKDIVELYLNGTESCISKTSI